MKKIITISILGFLLLTGCVSTRDKKPLPEKAFDWNIAFEKNAELENIYKKSNSLPAYHTLCIPVKKYSCGPNGCSEIQPVVFVLLGGKSQNATYSRCDSSGCDTYEAMIGDSGDYKNIQPVEPRGFLSKMSYNTIDKKFTEIVTLGIGVDVSYGYCLYDFQLPK